MRYLHKVLIVFISTLTLCSCNNQSDINNKSEVISDIAYDKDNTYGFRVYLEENNILTPFLVLDSDYNNNCLILREFLLDDSVAYNSSGEYSSYYNNSIIDNFLNDEYFSRFSEKVQNLIIKSDIEITSKNAIDTHDDDIEIITRDVFLLSANEVNSSIGYSALKEGDVLSYFKNIDNRIAVFENLEASSWMLRTPALRDGNTVFGVSDDGAVGMGGVNNIAGDYSNIRPAFCLPADTDIYSDNNKFYLK